MLNGPSISLQHNVRTSSNRKNRKWCIWATAIFCALVSIQSSAATPTDIVGKPVLVAQNSVIKKNVRKTIVNSDAANTTEPELVSVTIENRSGAVLDLYAISDNSTDEIPDAAVIERLHPDTALSIDAVPGESLLVALLGQAIGQYQVTAEDSTLLLTDEHIKPTGIDPTADLLIRNFEDTPVTLLLVTEDEEPTPLVDIAAGHELNGSFPAGSWLIVKNPSGQVIEKHLVIPLEEEVLNISSDSQ